MTGCCRAGACEEVFKPRIARRNLTRYRKKGLGAIERQMVASIQADERDGARVLEIGGGIGTIQTELLMTGAKEGEIVELVSAYGPYARELAQEKGFESRSRFRVADVLEQPEAVEPAAIVILNRVVCCSADGVRLTEAAARLTERILILSFPRDRVLVQVFARAHQRRPASDGQIVSRIPPSQGRPLQGRTSAGPRVCRERTEPRVGVRRSPPGPISRDRRRPTRSDGDSR